jgi:hypothetical protein
MLRFIRAFVNPAESAICGELPGVVDVWADDGREWRNVGVRQLGELAYHQDLELFDRDGRRVKVLARDVRRFRHKAAAAFHGIMLSLSGRG